MKTEYAKGPWSIGRESWAEGHRDINSPDHGALAIVVWEMEDDKGHNDDLGGSAQCRANARLIAAAPELLEACQEALRLVDWLEALAKQDVEIYKHELRGNVEVFRARILPAITKALGGNHG